MSRDKRTTISAGWEGKYHRGVNPIRPRTALALVVLALLVRLCVVPTWSRLGFEGHEALYLQAFRGDAVPATTQAYPLLCALYRGIGLLTQEPRVLVVLAALAGAAAVLGAAVWVGRWVSPAAGVWTGVLVALLPEHAAWSTSAYNVILPQALVVWAFAIGGKRALVLVALAVSMRMELMIMAAPLGWPALGGLVGPAWGLELPQVSPPGEALMMNLAVLGTLGPPVLFLGLLGLRDPRVWRLGGVVLWVHVVGATFDDYGARHALLGSTALCGMVAASADRWRGLIPVLGVVGCIWGLVALRPAWQGTEETVGGELLDLADALGPLPDGCVEVTEEPPLQSQQALPSHQVFLSGELREMCVVWGEEFWHRRWSSRGLQDRARRMRTLYWMTPVGASTPAGGGPVRIYQRLEPIW